MVEEEKEAYAEAVSLTLSQDEHTRKTYDSIKKCSQAHELIKLVRELQIRASSVQFEWFW